MFAGNVRGVSACVLLAEPSLRKWSGSYLPKYLRIPNALRLNGYKESLIK